MQCREFQGKTTVLGALAAQLARAKSDCEKLRLARLMRQEAETLFDCLAHDESDQDCKNCRAMAARRRRGMERLIGNLKAGMPGGTR